MRVLVVGSGGREHALCWSIAKSPLCNHLYCAPGNAGIASVAECVEVASDDVVGLVDFSQSHAIDFVVVGPEAPLMLGLIDRLNDAGILCFGPSREAAMIEGSKGFMKDLCTRHNIPTANYERFDEPEEAKEYILRHGAPLVVKADGLAAGKGVFVCHNENEGYAAIDHLMIEGTFGEAGTQVVVEDFLHGEEVSFFALVNGTVAVPLFTAQDHKPAFDGDTGPNTGGMGAYSPAPCLSSEAADEIMDKIVNPTIRALAEEGRPYCGVLFAGLILTPDGPKLLEYNARFGDPECQAMVVRLDSDLLTALVACARGRMNDIRLKWSDDFGLVVVMATHGYPNHYGTGTEIRGLDRAESENGVVVFHAGTKAADHRILAHGGRVLGVTAWAPSIEDVRARAYHAVDLIDWPEGFCRRDIGWRALGQSPSQSKSMAIGTANG